MSITDYSLPFKSKKDILIIDNLDEKYSNLNLNQNQKCLNFNPIISKSYTFGNRKGYNNDLIETKNSQTKKIFTSWRNSKKSLNFLIPDQNSGNKALKGGHSNTSIKNNSTLSLHISVYESSIETAASESDSFNVVGFKKNKSYDLKNQLFPDLLSIIQNPFEFPRQQKADQNINEPEVMGFKANQKLLNPNQSIPSKNDQSKNDSTQKSPAQISNVKEDFPVEAAAQLETKIAEPTVQSPTAQIPNVKAEPTDTQILNDTLQSSTKFVETPNVKKVESSNETAQIQQKQIPDRQSPLIISVTKEAEYETKFADRYKDANFQSKEKMPEPFIWINMPSQKFRNDRTRQRGGENRGRNSDDYYYYGGDQQRNSRGRNNDDRNQRDNRNQGRNNDNYNNRDREPRNRYY
uniref:Uncharacterized protein n=1 Tax=Panagrolaimus sp. PS1159 TaxID=55785 RepID=A0AC35GEG2_9BILA